MKKDSVMDWGSPQHASKTKDGTTQESDTFLLDGGYVDTSYVVHNNRFGKDCTFSKKVLEEETTTRVKVTCDYDPICGCGEESIAIRISEREYEVELLDGLIEKTQEALKLMMDRKAFLKKTSKHNKAA